MARHSGHGPINTVAITASTTCSYRWRRRDFHRHFFYFRLHAMEKHQPYSKPEHLLSHTFPLVRTVSNWLTSTQTSHFSCFRSWRCSCPQLRRGTRNFRVAISIVSLSYIVLVMHFWYSHPGSLLEPTIESWIGRAWSHRWNVSSRRAAYLSPHQTSEYC